MKYFNTFLTSKKELQHSISTKRKTILLLHSISNVFTHHPMGIDFHLIHLFLTNRISTELRVKDDYHANNEWTYGNLYHPVTTHKTP